MVPPKVPRFNHTVERVTTFAITKGMARIMKRQGSTLSSSISSSISPSISPSISSPISSLVSPSISSLISPSISSPASSSISFTTQTRGFLTAPPVVSTDLPLHNGAPTNAPNNISSAAQSVPEPSTVSQTQLTIVSHFTQASSVSTTQAPSVSTTQATSVSTTQVISVSTTQAPSVTTTQAPPITTVTGDQGSESILPRPQAPKSQPEPSSTDPLPIPLPPQNDPLPNPSPFASTDPHHEPIPLDPPRPDNSLPPLPSPSLPPNNASPVPEPPSPVQTQTIVTTDPRSAPGTSTTPALSLLPIPTSIGTNTAIGDQESVSSLSAPPARIQSGDIGNAEGKSTTVEVPTTIVTSGVFTTDLSTVLPNGETTVIASTSTGIHTITTTTAVPTQIGTVSSKSRPPTGIIVGIIGALAVVFLSLVVFRILARRKRLNKPSQVAWGTGLPTSSISAISKISIVPHTFPGTSPPHEQPAEKREGDQLEYPHPPPPHNRTSDRGNADPFRDPETIQGQEDLAMGANNALGYLQELTREAEEELRELRNRAQHRQLSDSERERLEEIRRTTGLTITYDPGRGRFSITSSATSFTTPPPSYHSN